MNFFESLLAAAISFLGILAAGLLISLLGAISFWISWIYFKVGENVFPFLPESLINISFWMIFGMFFSLKVFLSNALPNSLKKS